MGFRTDKIRRLKYGKRTFFGNRKPCLTSAISWQDFRKVTDDGMVLNKLNPATNAVQVVGQYEGAFDGVGKGISESHQTTNALTIVVKAKLKTIASGFKDLVADWTQASKSFMITKHPSNGRYIFYISVDGATSLSVLTDQVLPLNEDITIVGRYDGAEQCVFVNGIKQDNTRPVTGIINKGRMFRIAGETNLNKFNHYETVIYDRALTNEEISVVSKHNCSAVSRDKLVRYITSLTGQGSILYNTSAYTELLFTESDYFNNISSYISAGSSVKLRTSATFLRVKILCTMFSMFPQLSQIIVNVNDTYNQTITVIQQNNSIIDINLPAGNKVVELINGSTSQPDSSVLKTVVIGVLSYSSIKLITPFKQSKSVVFLGDSITVGANAELASYNGYVGRIRRSNSNVSFAIEGYGYATLFDYKDDINTLVAGFITTDKIYIALGTNDYALNKWDDIVDFQASYAELLDQIHNDLPNCKIYCQTPIIRQTETANSKGQTTQDFRDAIISECNSRSWCNLINGENILTLADLMDGVHPTTAGHLKYADAINDLFVSNEPVIPNGHGVLRNDIDLNVHLTNMDLVNFWQQGEGKPTLALEGCNYSEVTGYIPARNDGSGLDATGQPIQIKPYDWAKLPLYSFRYPSSLPIMDKSNTTNWSDNTGGLDWTYDQLKSIPTIKKLPIISSVFTKYIPEDMPIDETIIYSENIEDNCLKKTLRYCKDNIIRDENSEPLRDELNGVIYE